MSRLGCPDRRRFEEGMVVLLEEECYGHCFLKSRKRGLDDAEGSESPIGLGIVGRRSWNWGLSLTTVTQHCRVCRVVRHRQTSDLTGD
jgi:hypothetical protein